MKTVNENLKLFKMIAKDIQEKDQFSMKLSQREIDETFGYNIDVISEDEDEQFLVTITKDKFQVDDLVSDETYVNENMDIKKSNNDDWKFFVTTLQDLLA